MGVVALTDEDDRSAITYFSVPYPVWSISPWGRVVYEAFELNHEKSEQPPPPLPFPPGFHNSREGELEITVHSADIRV